MTQLQMKAQTLRNELNAQMAVIDDQVNKDIGGVQARQQEHVMHAMNNVSIITAEVNRVIDDTNNTIVQMLTAPQNARVTMSEQYGRKIGDVQAEIKALSATIAAQEERSFNFESITEVNEPHGVTPSQTTSSWINVTNAVIPEARSENASETMLIESAVIQRTHDQLGEEAEVNAREASVAPSEVHSAPC